MGLRLVAHYYDRVEALIVSATLDAVGIPNWVENYLQNAVQPFHEIGLGGYRIMVCSEDMGDAVDTITRAVASPISEGGKLIRSPILWPVFAWLLPVLPFLRDAWGMLALTGWVAGFFIWLLLPVKHREWRDG